MNPKKILFTCNFLKQLNWSVITFLCIQYGLFRDEKQGDGAGDKVYRDISNKYLPEIRRVLGTVKQ